MLGLDFVGANDGFVGNNGQKAAVAARAFISVAIVLVGVAARSTVAAPPVAPATPPVANGQNPTGPTVNPPPTPTPTSTQPVGTQPAGPNVAGMSDEDFLQTTGSTLAVKKHLDDELLDLFGVRSSIADRGLTLSGSYIMDDSHGISGGGDTRTNIFRSLLDVRLTLDTHAAFRLPGGTLSVDFQNQSGRNGSVHVGDFQGFDNADSDGRTQLNELWYQQLLLGDKVRIKVGKVDANSEFAAPTYTTGFINSSWGYSPTITGFPTYPDPATSVNLFVYPTRWFYAGVGLYDGGGANFIATGSYGPAKIWHGGESSFSVGEFGFRWLLADSTLPGRVAFGGTWQSGEFQTFSGGTQHGAASFYSIAEQKIFHPDYYDKTNPAGVYLSLQYGHGDGHVNGAADHIGGAVVWVMPYKKENPDSLGLGATAVRFTDDPNAVFTGDFETSIEGYYNFQLTKWLTIKPDLQYIVNPGGNRDLDNALVATVRVIITF
jgi:porin